MDLQTFIEAHGDERAAALFGVKERTTASWRRGERWPKPKSWRRIVEASERKVSVDDLIRGPKPAEQAAA